MPSTPSGEPRSGLASNDFVENLRRCGLFTPGELDAALQSLPSAAANSDGDALAKALVAAGLLTPFQAEAVRGGKFDELLIGNYAVLGRLGAGGMGTVFKARHRRMKRVVALKVLSRNLAHDGTFLQRFQREVETIAKLSHPNIVMAYDADEADIGPFLVMEYVDGSDLATVVQREGPLPVPAAVRCVLQAARGLEYAHSQGLVHRDIKPANLLRDAAGVVKVTDLGVARFNNPEAAGGLDSITQTGGVLGSVHYMSPEQALDSTKLDGRADVYSLGATLYFLLCGEPPYQASTMMAILVKHRDAPVPSVKDVRPDVPAAVEAVFRRMMAKNPAERYATTGELVRELEAIESSLCGSLDETAAAIPHRADESALDFSVASAPGEPVRTGSTVAPEETVVPTPPAAPPGRRTVLLVEPSRTQSAIIRKFLGGQSVERVVTVPSGQAALGAVADDRPQVVLSALHLPDMTGVELATQLHQRYRAAAPGFVLISSEAECAQAEGLSACGNTFLLHKPFTPAQLGAALRLVVKEPSANAAADRGKLRVLVADDSAAARLHVRGVLAGLGFKDFIDAADGAAAVAAAAKHTFDLIVTDYNMPFLDGHGLVSYLKQNPATAQVPIIMVTTVTEPSKLAAVRQLGVAAICDKSFPAEQVRKILDQVVPVP